MDAKITKTKIDKHLEYDWFKYILVVIAAVLIWLAIYSVMDNPRDYETIDFFVSVKAYHSESETSGESNLKTQVQDALSANEDKIIRQTNIIYFMDERQYMTSAATCDYFICTDKTISKMEEVLLPIDGYALGLINIAAADYELYYTETEGVIAEYPCAVRLKGAKLSEWLPKTVTAEDEEGEEYEEEQIYYIGIIGPNMMGGGNNIGKYNDKKSGPDNIQAFYIMKKILEYYKD